MKDLSSVIKNVSLFSSFIGTGSTVILAIYAVDLYFQSEIEGKIWFLVLIGVLAFIGFVGQILTHFLKDHEPQAIKEVNKQRIIIVREQEKGIEAMTDTWTEQYQ